MPKVINYINKALTNNNNQNKWEVAHKTHNYRKAKDPAIKTVWFKTISILSSKQLLAATTIA